MIRSSLKYFFTLSCIFLMYCCHTRRLALDSTIVQGIEGFVREIKGNQMPSPSRKPASPKVISTAIFVYELTNINETEKLGASPFYNDIHTRLLQSVMSDSAGHFAVSLPPGNYSLFTRVNGKYYANSFDANNNIQPVVVEKNKITRTDILISAEATF